MAERNPSIPSERRQEMEGRTQIHEDEARRRYGEKQAVLQRSAELNLGQEPAEAKARRTAGDVMTTDVCTVQEDARLEEIAQRMVTHRISGVPVVDAQGRVVGMVSEADLIDEHKRNAKIPRVALYGFFPVPDDVLKRAFHAGKELKARDVMTKRVITATEDRPVRELAEMMVMRKINRVPIVRDGKLVGIVSRGDLVRALARAGDL